MSGGWLGPATLAATLGAGLMAGFFYGFSNVVMGALGRRPAAEAVAALRAINVVVLNPLFFLLFFGTAALSLLLGVLAILEWRSGPPLLLGGALCYLLGILGVTVFCNVPRNERLAKLDPADAATAAAWQRYLRDWTAWNHVRSLAGAAATGFFAAALA